MHHKLCEDLNRLPQLPVTQMNSDETCEGYALCCQLLKSSPKLFFFQKTENPAICLNFFNQSQSEIHLVNNSLADQVDITIQRVCTVPNEQQILRWGEKRSSLISPIKSHRYIPPIFDYETRKPDDLNWTYLITSRSIILIQVNLETEDKQRLSLSILICPQIRCD